MANVDSQTHSSSNRRLAAGVLTSAIAIVGALLVRDRIAEQSTDTRSDQTPATGLAQVGAPESNRHVPFEIWLDLLSDDDDRFHGALRTIGANWQGRFVAPLLDVAIAGQNTVRGNVILAEIERQTKLRGTRELDDWYRRLVWKADDRPIENYAELKAAAFSRIDSRFAEYFRHSESATIRLDEIRWGGVVRDGIPPLEDPDMVTADHPEAGYLDDSDVVFGVKLNGESKCYPKRILAWHEMVNDTVGETSICGVYCTLCGSMIVYRTNVGGKDYELGTSGFLYRSNKLMYDHETKSMWSTLKGEPVVGPLVGHEIDGRPLKLEREAVVTTTWGAWRRQHPDTRVLTLRTGHRRDYAEGVAYRDYFSTDRLMFQVPNADSRLPNKAEVIALRFDDSPGETLAISTEFLATRPVYEETLGTHRFVILTDRSGASRVYETVTGGFVSWDGQMHAESSDGRRWTVTETALRCDDVTLRRLPSHRAFWFGWHAAFPETRVVY